MDTRHFYNKTTFETRGYDDNVDISEYINLSEWTEYTLGQEPQVLIDANTKPKTSEDLRLEAKQAREDSLNGMVHTLSDGSVVQVRQSDLTNFQIAIQVGVSKDWVLADNSVRLLTVAEMQECLNSGIAQAEVIWKTYTDFLKAN